MTALEEILQTEQTAEKEIANAKEVAAAAVSEAKQAAKEKLSQVDAAYESTKIEALEKQSVMAAKVSEKITTESEQRIKSLTANFAAKQAALVQMLKDRFVA